MKILVTGGAGFIGSAVIRHILDNTSDSVINVDALTYAGNIESIPNSDSHSRYCFEHINICDRAEVERIFREHQPDAVMHLAAESHVDRSIDGPSVFIQTNLVGTFNVIDTAYQYWRSLTKAQQSGFRFHHISTDEVYGDLAQAAEPFTEATAYQPSSPYSATKAGSDHLVSAWGRTYGLPIIITSCSNNYGPYHFPEKLIPHMILNALQAKALPVYGSGLQVRDWLYVEDHARGLYTVLTRGEPGQRYNIGGYNEKTNIEVVETLCVMLEEMAPDKPAGIKHYRDLISYVEDRPGHDMRYAIDASKIQRELGWVPKESFDSGMRKTVGWYLDNREWWQRVLSGVYKLNRQGAL